MHHYMRYKLFIYHYFHLYISYLYISLYVIKYAKHRKLENHLEKYLCACG